MAFSHSANGPAPSEQPTVVVTGGTGFVGGALIGRLLEKGYQVRCLTRDPQKAIMPPGVTPVGWDDVARGLEEANAVVHLAGAPAVGTRLTEERKRLIMDSRVETTKKLVSAMQKMPHPPATFVCASAIGYYGNRPWGDIVTENSPTGDDFLALVCRNWEAAAREAEKTGIRVVRARMGIVLGSGGGPLAVMALPFKMFVGGPIAGGKQPVSWIDLRDAVEALLFCVENSAVRGPVNVVAPSATTNGELSRAIAKTLSRPNLLPVPKWGLRLLFSDGADTIASGQHVAPARLLDTGFQFRHARLETILGEHLR